MMRQGKILGLCSLFFCIVSCGPSYYSDHFITGYISHPEINLVSFPEERLIVCEFKYNSTQVINSDNNVALYEAISEKNMDVSYCRERRHWEGFPVSIFPDIESVIVTCDGVYDQDHNSNSSLNDIIKIRYSSYENYISSGYKGEECESYSVLLEDNPDLNLIDATGGSLFAIEFTSNPSDISASYNIKVLITYIDGTKISRTVEYRIF